MADRDKPSMRRSLKLVAPDVAPHRALILFGVLALLLEVAFRVLEPWPLKIVVDAVTAFRGAKVSHQPASVELLIGCGVALLLIVGLRALSNYLATICFALVGSRAATSLRARVFRHVQGLSQQFHARNRSADTVQRIVGDVARMQEVAITAGMPLLANVATLLVMVVVMFVLDPLLASVVLVAVVAFAVTSGPTSRKITAASRQTRKGEGQLANTAQESLASIRVVQAYGLENLVEENFTSANRTSLREGVRSRRYAARLERTTDVIVGLATAIVLVGGGLRVMQGAMSPGDLVLFITYLRTTMKPLRDMAKYTGRIARASASGERVADLMEITPDVVTPDEPVRPDVVTGAVRFDRVVTEYDGVEVLHEVSLDVPAVGVTALVGESGSGKSTVAALLAGRESGWEGQLLLGGKPLEGFSRADLARYVTTVPSAAHLFRGSVRENLLMARPDASDGELWDALGSVSLAGYLRTQQGLDTVVEQEGQNLSGGQRQRLALARALLHESSVLVLDEATSNVDVESEDAIMAAVREVARYKAVVLISHRLANVVDAPRVYVLEKGRVVGSGSHEELLRGCEAYGRLWGSQRELEGYAGAGAPAEVEGTGADEDE